MTEAKKEDWLRVVYGSGLEARRPSRPSAAVEITVRQSPPDLDPVHAPGGEQRVRVTVVPSEPGTHWSLYLRDFGPGPGEAAERRVWWRLEPGSWQPLGGTRQCVAKGRGRIRLDVQVRVEHDPTSGTVAPRLRFVAE